MVPLTEIKALHESRPWSEILDMLSCGAQSWPAEFGWMESGPMLTPRVWVNGVRTHVNSKGKMPSSRSFEENQTHNTASLRKSWGVSTLFPAQLQGWQLSAPAEERELKRVETKTLHLKLTHFAFVLSFALADRDLNCIQVIFSKSYYLLKITWT